MDSLRSRRRFLDFSSIYLHLCLSNSSRSLSVCYIGLHFHNHSTTCNSSPATSRCCPSIFNFIVGVWPTEKLGKERYARKRLSQSISPETPLRRSGRSAWKTRTPTNSSCGFCTNRARSGPRLWRVFFEQGATEAGPRWRRSGTSRICQRSSALPCTDPNRATFGPRQGCQID